MAYDNDKKFAGWIRTSDAGNKFISGTFELGGKKYQVNIMKQKEKNSEKSPDYWGTIQEAGRPDGDEPVSDDDVPF